MLAPPLLALALCVPNAPPGSTGDPILDLEPRFAAARKDPAQIVPLILEASAAISAIDAQRGHELAERLEPYCKRAFFGPEQLPGMGRLGLKQHRVADGELPGRIARKHGTGAGLYAYLNESYNPRKVRAGQRLKVLDLSDRDLTLIVDRSRFRLSAWRRVPGEDSFVLMAYVKVGLGAPESPTPLGRTKITSRVLDPQWKDPVSGQVFAPDDPGNLLGGYWMALEAEGLGEEGIGFHGYTGEAVDEWLGRAKSNGCVRMRQEDIDRVFHLALEGTSVQIVP